MESNGSDGASASNQRRHSQQQQQYAKQSGPAAGSVDPSLPLKYQKLLSEYSKLRNQIVQLTRYLTDEQKAVKHFKEESKEKDKQIKKLQQDNESNSFRCQQLIKRISVLQEELKKKVTSGKGAVAAGLDVDDEDNLQSTFSIFDAELTSKIGEVAHLTEQLTYMQSENQSLREEIHQLHLQQSDSDFMIRSQDEVIQSQKVMIDELSQNRSRSSSQVESKLNVTTESSQASSSRINEKREEVEAPSQVSNLKESLEAADSKANLFSQECLRLKQRLTVAAEEKESLKKEVQDKESELQQTRDEFNTSVRNYEAQLAAMSEHLANITEKWSQQQIEMDGKLEQQTVPTSGRKERKKNSSSSKS